MSDADQHPQLYGIEYTDAAQEEIEQAYLWLSSVTSPESAAKWVEGLRTAINGLCLFPYRFQRAPEYLVSGREVRRLLYQKHRVLYLILEPEGEDTHGVVRVLHIYHGASEPPEESANGSG